MARARATCLRRGTSCPRRRRRSRKSSVSRLSPDLFRPQDPGFVILEVRGDEALGVHQGLLADVVGGRQVQVGLGTSR